MYAVTGITGQVGGMVARALLNQGQPVRAVVRDAAKGKGWAALGCEVAIADMTDAPALAKAFTAVDGAFLLIPPMFDPAPGFPEMRAVLGALTIALLQARPPKLVCLSTIGAQATQANLLSQFALVEHNLAALDQPITFLRAAWFIENTTFDLSAARDSGVIASFLQPIDRHIPMVATADIGRIAADLLQQSWIGRRVVNIEGPHHLSPLDLANAWAAALGHPVKTAPVPRENWEMLFRAQGAKNPEPRMRMLDGFNAGWISFDDDGGDPIRGMIRLEDVIAGIVIRSGPPSATSPISTPPGTGS